MRIIKNISDLRTLKKDEALEKEYLDLIKRYFNQLHKALGDGCSVEEFSLKNHGYIVVLEAEDNLSGELMGNVGLNPEGGIYVSWPEFVEEINLDSIVVYKINILYTNDFMMSFYIKKGINKKLEKWLDDKVDIDKYDGEIDINNDEEVPF